jgi:hypothetical protein
MKYPKIGSVIIIPNKTGEYVVEYVNWEGGGTGMSAGDIYPDWLHIKARKLNPKRKYVGTNKITSFVWGPSCYNTEIIDSVGCKVVGQMKQVVDFK